MQYANTVLVVDDSEMIVKVLSVMLKKSGYNILSAVNGNNALQFFDGREIDLVITDLNMPDMNGDVLISEIRQKEYYQFMPVILFFSGDKTDTKKYIKAEGATILFDKNDIRERILPTVKKIIG